MSLRFLASLFAIVSLGVATFAVSTSPGGAGVDPMQAAAQAFLASLDSDQRERALLDFEDENRTDWHYVPRRRPGVRVGDLGTAQQRAAQALLRSAVSSQGYFKATSTMKLEDILRAMHGNDRFSSDEYYIAFYGMPSASDPWGWKIEGHHLSLNFSSVDGTLVASTPAFIGAEPSEVRDGDLAGLRVLAREEDLALELFELLDDDQQTQAYVSERAPRDIVMAPGVREDGMAGKGVLVADMTEGQRALALRLIREYAGNLRHDSADALLERAARAGFEKVRFAWAGAKRIDGPHYYRLHGPTFLIELDNVQGGATHIHAVWRDLEDEFAVDTLREHYLREHGRGE